MSAEDIEERIDKLKATMTTLVDLMKDLEETRHTEVKALHKRVLALEYAFARHLEKAKGEI